MGTPVRTAVLVLAILADVFGGLGALAALLFGMTIAGLSGGFAGGGATGGALLALLALGIGIAGTVVATKRPRLGGAILVGAGILGAAGTFAFALGSLLYLIAGGMAFFIRTSESSGAVLVSAKPMALREPGPTRAAGVWPSLAQRRRTWVIASGVVATLLAVVAGSALAQPAEQRPVRALFEALAKVDDLALADLLAPELRSRTAARDAEAVLSIALGRSEIGFLNTDWLRRLGPLTGTVMRFENLTMTTTTRSATAAVVHVRGTFAPTNENSVMQLLLGGLRQPFDADIVLNNTAGAWYVSAAGSTAAAPSSSPRLPAESVQAPTAPAQPSSPAVHHLALGTYSAPSTSTLTDIGGWRATLRDITVNVDESLLFEFDLTVGATDGPWAGRESRLELRSGVWLQVIGSKSTFYDGGKGSGATVRVALAFPPGLAGNQPYVLRICGNLGYCWAPLPGPLLGER
jgi:hypothetical protein